MKYPCGQILVFCKAPRPGQVKTRLGKDIGVGTAAGVHRHLARHCLRRAVNARLAPVTLFCSPDTEDRFFHACREEFGVSLIAQQGADLGARMQHALETMLRQASPVLLMGTDCPALTMGYLHSAMVAASEGKTVIGPAEDGGYVLLAMNEPHDEIFNDIDWGSSRVYSQTLARITGRVETLENLWDVDRLADLRRLRDGAEALGLDDTFQDHLQSLELPAD